MTALLGLGVSAVGGLILLGWWLGVEGLACLALQKMPVAPNAAAGLVLGGGALAIQSLSSRTRSSWRLDEIAAALVLLLGVATLVEWTVGVGLGIDELLLADGRRPRGPGAPSRMAPTAAFGFVLIGAGLLLIDSQNRGLVRLAHGLALGAGLIGLVSIIGHVYGAGPGLGISGYANPMAVGIALAFLALSIGVQLRRPDHLLAGLGTSDGPAGALIRRFLPISLVAPVVVGWIHLEGRRAGYYGTELGLALYCTVDVVGFAALIAWIAHAAEEQDRARREAERMLKEVNDELELRVELRTAAISDVNTNLRQEIRERKRAQEAEHTYAELLKVTIDGAASDQTEKRRADAEVRELRRAMESAVEGIARLDAAGRYLAVNAAYAATLGCASQDLIGQPWQSTIHPGARAAMEQVYARMLELGTAKADTVGVRRDGSTFDRQIVLVAVRSDGGEFGGHYHFSKDVTQQKEGERELVRAKQAAETAMRARSDFLARMSHEMRTPMNGVLGMTELTLATPLTAQQREYVDIAHDSATSLLHLIDEILDFARIDSGHIRLESRPFSLRSCLASALKGLAQRAHAKGLDFLLDVAPDVPEHLVGDPQRLVQVVINLVGNALKFTEMGHIHLSVTVGATSLGAPVLYFAVSDTGIGIEASKQDAIFDSFVQADDTVAHRYGGTGLGLAISRQLVELMRGTIGVESQPGRGSTFWFTAQMERAADGVVEDDPLRSLRGTCVLVLEEDPTRRRVVCQLLEVWGMRPAAATIGEEPPRLDRPFAFALVAAGLVERRGAAALAGIADGMPVVLVGPGSGAPPGLGGRSGAVVSLTWPITAAGLYEATGAARDRTSGRAGQQLGPAPGAVALRVLLAEDNPVNRRLATEVLQRAGHEVVAVEDGLSAVAYAENNDVDVILIDIQMPIMDGLTATRLIRESDRGGRGYVSIIGLTAQAMREVREHGLAAGLDAYVVKPFVGVSLLAEIDRVVARTASRREGGARRQGRMGGDAPPVFDRQLVLHRIGGDEALLLELIEMFLSDLPAKRDAIAAAVQTGEAIVIERTVHALRGALLSLAAGPAAEAAWALERASASPERAVRLAAALAHELERLADVLGAIARSA